jgi:hypothetical protein
MPTLRQIYKNNDLTSLLTTKGDIPVRGNSTEVVRLPRGVNNQLLVSDDSASTGISWQYVDVGFATVNSNFITPAVGNTVTISVSTNRWVYPGMYIYIQDAGVYYVVSKSGSNSITVRNEYSTNTVGATIGITKAIVPTGQKGEQGLPGLQGTPGLQGLPGVDGVSAVLLNLSNSYIQPNIGNTVQIAVTSTTAFLSAGAYIYITVGGFYEVVSIDSTSTLTIKNLDVSINATSGVSIASGAVITPSGKPGLNGLDGVDGQGIDHIELTSTIDNIDTYTIWADVAETISLGTFQVINGIDGIDGAIGSVSAATSLYLNHQSTPPANPTGQLVLYSTIDGLYYKQPNETSKLILIEDDIGVEVGDIIALENVNGIAGLPAVDGSQLLNLPVGLTNINISLNSVDLTPRTKLNFIGDLVNATDDVVNGVTNVTISSGLTNLGDLLYFNGSSLSKLSKGIHRQILSSDDTLGLTWIDIPTGVTSYNDLTDKPTLGTSASKNTGTLSNQVLAFTEDNKLPALDGSLLTNLPNTGGGHIIQDEGIDKPARTNINFVGNLVSITDNSIEDSTDVNINLPNVINLGAWTP